MLHYTERWLYEIV